MASGDWRDAHRLQERSIDAPAPTLDSKVGSAWQIHLPGQRGHGRKLTIEEAAVLQTFPMIERHRGAGMLEREGERPTRSTDHPALTITGNASGTTPGGFRFTDGKNTRPMTIQEAAALQTYPTSWPASVEPLDITALDDFAGSGWGVACHWLGIQERGVEIMDEAVATREANGMVTIGRDVWDHLAELLKHPWTYDLYIASPPCQTFSMAGKGAGRKALDEVIGLIDSKAYRDVEMLRAFGERHDPRTALVLVPLVRAYRDLPRYIVLEQVPTVLPVWERMAEELRSWGYSVWVGKLYAEQYGVPQTRIRAVLIAKRDPDLDGEASPPLPTHSRYYSRNPAKLDEGVEKWVSMAEALGWGMTERPSMTVTGGGASTGGAEPFGTGARDGIRREEDAGRWMKAGAQAKATVRHEDEPAATITGGHDSAERVWLVSNYTDRGENGVAKEGNKLGRAKRESDQPSVAVTSKAGSMVWQRPDGEAINLDPDKPATTVAADPRLTSREHHFHGEQNSTSTRVTLDEAATLQSYPQAFEFAGGKGKQFLQVGNAVPPLLAYAVLRAVLS